MNTYLTIDEQDEKYIINVEISDSEKIDRNKLNKTIKQISKFIKKNDKKRKDVIIKIPKSYAQKNFFAWLWLGYANIHRMGTVFSAGADESGGFVRRQRTKRR